MPQFGIALVQRVGASLPHGPHETVERRVERRILLKQGGRSRHEQKVTEQASHEKRTEQQADARS